MSPSSASICRARCGRASSTSSARSRDHPARMTIVCGDSHTSTHSAVGTLAFGIGTSEVEHVLATQTLLRKPAKNMLVRVDGSCRSAPRPRTWCSRSSAGSARRAATATSSGRRRGDPGARRGRANDGLRHVDRGGRPRRADRVRRAAFDWIKGRPYAPKGEAFEQAIVSWRTCRAMRARTTTRW